MLYLVRHGQTALNRANLLQGRSDTPLNDTGREQARDAGRLLAEKGVRFARVYTSPLRRAVETARLIAPGVPLRVDERLIEMDYGPYEGTDLRHLPPEIITFFSDFVHNRAPEGMEQLSAVTARLGAFLEELKGEAEDGDILISTHAIALKGALEYLDPSSGGGWWSRNIGNCAVFAACLADGAYTVPELLEP
ncbi:MAG: histidine phosphatase family protein [Oscillospiraceae bacterium]|nr:histidine phosphatase family protein [Oscillospiraceae bacterium]